MRPTYLHTTTTYVPCTLFPAFHNATSTAHEDRGKEEEVKEDKGRRGEEEESSPGIDAKWQLCRERRRSRKAKIENERKLFSHD